MQLIILFDSILCQKEAPYKVSVDDGDGRIHACQMCLKRYLTKTLWFGWFDDEVPPETNLRGSNKFWWAVWNAYFTEKPTAEKKGVGPVQLTTWLKEKRLEQSLCKKMEGMVVQ